MDLNSSKPRLRGMSETEIVALLNGAGFQEYRGRQVYHWIQRQGVRSFDEMKNIPAPMRQWLAENTLLGGVKDASLVRESLDGSYKFLFELEDGRKVESVLMPDPEKRYWTQCLSSQVGCAVDCKFCVTGFNGFFRNMRVDEIVDQVLFAKRYLLERRPGSNYRNLVYMGMGEPLLNPDAVIASIRILTSSNGLDLSGRRITVSTSGIVPGMIQLAESGAGACLAVSLNAPTQEERAVIMPISKKWPIEEVLDVCRRYTFCKNKRVTFEYVMLAGVNDSLEHATKLKKLLRGISCKVNLIPFNPSPLLPYGRPDQETVQQFVESLYEAQFTVSVRWSKALDVDGACGQLAGQSRQRGGRRGEPPTENPKDEMPEDLDFFAVVAGDDDAEEK